MSRRPASDSEAHSTTRGPSAHDERSTHRFRCFRSLAQRQLEPEVMDQPGLDPALHHQALDGLRRVNWWSGTGRVLWRKIARLVREERMPRLSILDLACGGGDVTLSLARHAQRLGIPVTVEGWDKSDTAVAYAQDRLQRSGIGLDVSFRTCDVLETPIDRPFDVVCTTLFLHHLTDAEAIQLLSHMKLLGSRLLLVDDLCRTHLGYFLAQTACRLLSRSPVVHTDGPLSVRAAFCAEEVLNLASVAGWERAEFQRHWPERYLLSWHRS